jgi:hypothetical protein
VESAEARAVLGVEANATANEIRAAFRALLRNVHPDVARGNNDANEATRALLHAYRLSLDTCVTEDSTVDAALDRDARAWLVDRDTVALACSHEEAFARLLDVGSTLGVITYLDRQGELIEVLLRTRLGDTVSLVISFQGRADWVEAFLTTEVLDVARHELPTIDQITELVLFELRRRW